MKRLLLAMLGVAMLVFTVSAVTLCPLDPLVPSEASVSNMNYNISQGGSTNNVFVAHSSDLSGEIGDVTGYVSSNTNILGVAGSIEFASEKGSDSGTYGSTTGVDLTGGRLIGSESVMMSYLTPNGSCDENSTYVPFCEYVKSDYKVDLTEGGFGSTISSMAFISTNKLTHQSVVQGSGTYSAGSAIGLMSGCNGSVSKYQFSSDGVSLTGSRIEFGRVVQFLSTR
jgi:hypothetical protein